MYDVIIIGGGPAGLTAAIYARRANLKTLVLEATACGGQIIIAPDIENYPAAMHISGLDFASRLESQANELGAEIKFEEVTGINDRGTEKDVQTDSNTYTGKTIIIATGTNARKLGLPGEEELVGHGISYCATCDGTFYRGRVVAVNGGGNTALEDALFLSNIAEKVYLIHRRDQFRGDAEVVEKIKAKDNIELLLNSQVTKLNYDNKLNSIEVTNNDGTKQNLEIGCLFIAIGRIPATKAFQNKITMHEDGFIEGEYCHTNVPGIFVAGDCRNKEVRQLVTATSDGAVAVHEVLKLLNK
ncbi:thioredoxin-disulfide reductase [Candidatus Saccharibacteria bacterium]|nr:thioredoxin-disulfide reductase [Candidatus Saccharibacteria bacterium]